MAVQKTWGVESLHRRHFESIVLTNCGSRDEMRLKGDCRLRPECCGCWRGTKPCGGHLTSSVESHSNTQSSIFRRRNLHQERHSKHGQRLLRVVSGAKLSPPTSQKLCHGKEREHGNDDGSRDGFWRLFQYIFEIFIQGGEEDWVEVYRVANSMIGLRQKL